MKFLLIILLLTLSYCTPKNYFIEKTDKYNIGDTIGGNMLIVGKDRSIYYTDWQYEYIFIQPIKNK